MSFQPKKEHRCQLVQRLARIFSEVVKNCNSAWKSLYGDMMNSLLQNNQSGRQGKACEPVKYLI